MGSEAVEFGEGGVIEDLEALTLSYEEVARWIGVRECGLVCADLLWVLRDDRRC